MSAALVLVVVSAIGLGQAAGAPAPGESPPPPPSEPTFQVEAGLERRRDRITYRFENRSNFNTTELVDHFFQQRYEADNTWLVLRGGYRSSPTRRWVAEVGFTPEVVTYGEDLDTFYNPGNNVIVSGTTGDVDLRSARAAGWLERARRGELVERFGYSYRRDRSHFHTPIRKIVSTSRPASVQESVTFARETTISEVHQVWVGWTKYRALGPRWRLGGDVSAAPATLARLTTILPDKYPGQDIVFWASGFEVAGRVTLARDGRWPIRASVDLGRTFTYQSSARFIRNSLGASIGVGFTR